MINQSSIFQLSDIGSPEANKIYFHKYEIFVDLSRKGFITGKELEAIHKNKDLSREDKEKQSKRWLFFYRAQPRLLPHKKLKEQVLDEISTIEKQVKAEEKLVPIPALLIVFLVGLLLVRSDLLSLYMVWFFVCIVATLYYYYRFDVHAQRINLLSNKIELITDQYELLCDQIRDRYSRKKIDEKWKEDQEYLQSKVYRKFSPELANKSKQFFFIKSWGVQQPKLIETKRIYQDTGLDQVIDDMDKNCLTWRHGEGNRVPMFRLQFCQIVCVTSTGVFVGSFFYDIVRYERKYGERYDFIAKKHISDMQSVHLSAIREEALSDLAHEKFHPVIFVERLRSVSLSATSGNIVNCITPDAKGLQLAFNNWLEYRNLHQQFNNAVSDPESSDEDKYIAVENLEEAINEEEELVDEMVQYIYRKLSKLS